MSTTIDIIHDPNRNITSPSHTYQKKPYFPTNKKHVKNIIHSLKVGFALVLVSLIYIFDPLFDQVGENAMWAIMTVEVIFEFFAGLSSELALNKDSFGRGATLSKGILRGFGTIVGSGLGYLASILANDLGKNGKAVVIGTLIFIFGAMTTYCRFNPSINKRYDYGVMIFVLTFNLVAASSLRVHEIMELARKRLSAVGMGFFVSIFVGLLVFPMWASDEFHHLTSSKFNELASCIEECMEAYLTIAGQNKNQPIIHISSCKSVLDSKSDDESLVNFAKWEPRCGNFRFFNPWRKHQQTAELLRELASLIFSLQGCLRSPLQPSTMMLKAIKDPCKNVGVSLGLTMRELGESIMKKKRNQAKILTVQELQTMKLTLMQISSSTLQPIENLEDLAIANFLFLLMEIVDKVEELAKQVEGLGSVSGFQST
ncbi:hypothetical protein QVD17_33905 [Tagetes erecta]|uniref:Aluminum-activated malate transporter n=1 Tax=Tagetes erecta TaxID=13708 RepID=A0AAD8JXW7_TARER|nr:hypothetical protein QVD17_33905 [Tagetes erecta]